MAEETKQDHEVETVESSPEEPTLEEKLKQLEEENRQLKLQQQLKESGLDANLSKYLKDSVDITELTSIIKKSMIDNSYKADTTKKETVSVTKADFKKMGYVERLNLYNTNKELFEQLNK